MIEVESYEDLINLKHNVWQETTLRIIRIASQGKTEFGFYQTLEVVWLNGDSRNIVYYTREEDFMLSENEFDRDIKWRIKWKQGKDDISISGYPLEPIKSNKPDWKLQQEERQRSIEFQVALKIVATQIQFNDYSGDNIKKFEELTITMATVYADAIEARRKNVNYF